MNNQKLLWLSLFFVVLGNIFTRQLSQAKTSSDSNTTVNENRQNPTSATTIRYIPPNTNTRQQRTSSSGNRGGCNISTKSPGQILITLLSPEEHIPNTASDRPTLLFKITSIPDEPIIITVVDPDLTEPIVEKKIAVHNGGIIAFKIPPETPPLEVSKEYIWTVMIPCSWSSPSKNIYARASFKRVELSPLILSKLKLSSSPHEKASILANAGIWHDAVSLLYEAYQNNPTLKNLKDFQQLLSQGGLTIVDKENYF